MRHDASSGDGSKSIFIGFLSPSTDYSYRIVFQALDGRIVESVNDSFQTAASPYTWATGSNVKIRPGELTDTGCTLSFIFRDATNETLYAATAGHCATKKPLGSTWRIANQADTAIGVIAAYEYNAEGGMLDWALIRITPESRAFVNPSVRHWTGPTGVAVESDVAEGDTVCLYGWGQGYQTFENTRHRCGEFETWDSRSYETSYTMVGYSIHITSGDSGSPVIDYASGKGVAISVHGSVDTGGSAIFSVIERAAAHGIQVQLATAPYAPPPADDY